MLTRKRQSATYGILNGFCRTFVIAHCLNRPTHPFSCAGPTESVAHCELSQDGRPNKSHPWTPSVFYSQNLCGFCALPGIIVSPRRRVSPHEVCGLVHASTGAYCAYKGAVF